MTAQHTQKIIKFIRNVVVVTFFSFFFQKSGYKSIGARVRAKCIQVIE